MYCEYIVEPDKNGVQVYGGNHDFLSSKSPEAMLHGPAETGKTFALCLKIHLCACKYPRSKIALVRKTQTSCYNTVVRTFTDKILGPDISKWPCEPYGGMNKPERFNYHNGSSVLIVGMDKASKVLSAEFDILAVNQSEELTLDDWEICTTRTTGRAGNMPYAQTIGDMNPAYPAFWVYHRPSLKLFYSRHKENPALFDQCTNEITAQGKRTMSVLGALTGLRKIRLLEGKPAMAEGAIYAEWDDSIHLIDKFDPPSDWRRFRAIDFGYTNPFVCQWWAVDNDDRLYLYREIYHTRRTVRAHCEQINELSKDEHIEATICDHDAEDRATLRENGIYNIAAKKSISVGIEKVIERLKMRDDGRPGLYIMRDALVETDQSLKTLRMPVCTQEEIPGYVWANSKTKEIPVKKDDHGVDAERYMVMHLARGGVFLA